MRAKKNRTVAYLDSLDRERRDHILNKAVTFGRKQRDSRRQKQKDLEKELIKRQDRKQQERNEAKRRELERKLNQTTTNSSTPNSRLSAILFDTIRRFFSYISDDYLIQCQ